MKLKAIIATVEVFGPILDPENKATLMDWAQENMNENKLMFQTPMKLDIDALREYEPPMPMMPSEPSEPKPFAATDSASKRRRMRRLNNEELVDLVTMMEPSALAELKPNGKMNGHAHN